MDVVVPTLGESIAEATIARWLKQPGDRVKVDEPLAELETDKVTLEVNAPTAGVLGEQLFPAGASVTVGAVLTRIEAGEGGKRPATPPASATPPPPPPIPSSSTAPSPTPPAAPAAPAGTATRGLDPQAIQRSAPGGKIAAADLLAFLGGGAALPLSPAVRKLVAERHLDPSQIAGSGKGGRLTKGDVLQAAATTAMAAAAPATAVAPARGGEERLRMSKLRQTIARRLKEAQNTAAMLTTFNEVDMSAVMALRARHKDAFEKAHGVKLGFMSFFAKAAVAALQAVPAVNARLEGDEIVYARHYDIGMAVSTPAGLTVPVIRDCDRLSFAAIETSLGELAARARDGKLTLEEMQGGTFTITNGGVFGSLLSTPILNPPQSGILGLHKIEERPIAVAGQVAIRPMMYLALSYDHRLIDGREAVTFLVKVKDAIEAPERLLLGL